MNGQLEIDGAPERVPVLREGLCGCGCGEPCPGRKYVSSAHRQRAYRGRVKTEMERVGLPASPSLRAAGVSRPTTPRNGDAERGRKAPQRRRSGLQVSYPKAAARVAEVLEGYGEKPYAALILAEQTLTQALSPAQLRALRHRRGGAT